MQASKFLFSSAPKLRDGTGFMTILSQDYLGLWNTKEIKARREQMLMYPHKAGLSLFTTAKQKADAEKRWQHFTQDKPRLQKLRKPKAPDYTEALESLSILDQWGR